MRRDSLRGGHSARLTVFLPCMIETPSNGMLARIKRIRRLPDFGTPAENRPAFLLEHADPRPIFERAPLGSQRGSDKFQAAFERRPSGSTTETRQKLGSSPARTQRKSSGNAAKLQRKHSKSASEEHRKRGRSAADHGGKAPEAQRERGRIAAEAHQASTGNASELRQKRATRALRAAARAASPWNFGNRRKLIVDSHPVCCENSCCCSNVRRYLSWIEGLTTNQYVGGSNPSRRTIENTRSGAGKPGFFVSGTSAGTPNGGAIGQKVCLARLFTGGI